MSKYSTIIIFTAVLASVMILAGCPERVSIADIAANPSRYQNKEVIVAGTVRDSYGVAIPGTRYSGGAYKIDDGTGSIWIFTDDAVPARGTQIGIKGRIGSGVTWKGKTYGLGMYEKDRRLRRR